MTDPLPPSVIRPLLPVDVDASHPSVGAEREVFLALALHSAGRPEEALRTALEALVPTLPRYRRSVSAYAAELTD